MVFYRCLIAVRRMKSPCVNVCQMIYSLGWGTTDKLCGNCFTLRHRKYTRQADNLEISMHSYLMWDIKIYKYLYFYTIFIPNLLLKHESISQLKITRHTTTSSKKNEGTTVALSQQKRSRILILMHVVAVDFNTFKK